MCAITFKTQKMEKNNQERKVNKLFIKYIILLALILALAIMSMLSIKYFNWGNQVALIFAGIAVYVLIIFHWTGLIMRRENNILLKLSKE